jgi:hypothetical protein
VKEQNIPSEICSLFQEKTINEVFLKFLTSNMDFGSGSSSPW